MTAMNIVHMRVKPGREQEFVAIHEAFEAEKMPGGRDFWVVKTGERDFCVVAWWNGLSDLVAARAAMIANLDRLRPLLEDLGGGRGVTEPWSGEVAMHRRPQASHEL